jgi:hypothetical protein
MLRQAVFYPAGILFLLLNLQQTVFSEEEQSSAKITPSGFAYYQIGQIEQETPPQDKADKLFDQRFVGRLTLNAVINSKLKITIGAEGEVKAGLTDNTRISEVLLKEAHGIYSCGDPEHSFLQIQAGYFPFKYNPESRNLGEYLFRTGTYPGFIITDFDNPKTRLMGFNVSGTLFDNLRLNVLFTSEYTVSPFFDYSLSFIAGYKLPSKIIDIGAGVDFERLLPIGAEKENTEAVQNNLGLPIIQNGDTLRYSMSGAKLMGRCTFDAKPLLPFADIFGSEDLKLYTEIALLGVKNYGGTDSIGEYGYYPKILYRLPIMAGFNIPTFKTMDVLSFEWEYYGCNPRYKFDIPASSNPKPAPYTDGPQRSYIKWCFYGQKTITKGWAVKGLFGRDHFRYLNAGSIYDPIERMNGPSDWHYNVRIMYSF